jgi:hypothetical protein
MENNHVINKRQSSLIWLFLVLLPASYRDEAKTVFFEGDDHTVFNAFEYFCGGIDYRVKTLRRLMFGRKKKILVAFSPPVLFSRNDDEQGIVAASES